jgi:hypothetical protein
MDLVVEKYDTSFSYGKSGDRNQRLLVLIFQNVLMAYFRTLRLTQNVP